jgi:inosine-uridine nucleoside N-ribohydrolase
MRQRLLGRGEPVTLIATGPLTNVAVLLLAHPEVTTHIREIVVMGGSTDRGNSSPYAEFNIWADPEAADIVLNCGLPFTMCGLNVTHQALATPDVLDRIAALSTPLARICVDLLSFFAASYRHVFGFDAPPLHDPVAVARVVDPAVVTTVEANVAVELASPLTRGATVTDLHHVTGREPNAQVAITLDTARFWDLIVAAIATLG